MSTDNIKNTALEDDSSISFIEALKILNIEDYAQRIVSSNSRGELFYLEQYFVLARALKDNSEWFRNWFVLTVATAEVEWKRPESVFQHISTILVNDLSDK